MGSEKHRVRLHAWYDINREGGHVHPYGDPLDYWIVSKIHARYFTPEIKFGDVDEHGRELMRRFSMRAYLCDLDASEALNIQDLNEVMLYQEPNGWWFIKQVDDAYLAKIEPLRVERFESSL